MKPKYPAAPATRREFFADVGRGMLASTLGLQVMDGLGLGKVHGAEVEKSLNFGRLERLVCMMQETDVSKVLPTLVGELRNGTDLKTLTGAAALANARTFGGEDYVGFHTLMALAPAYQMSAELPEASRALPVLKVLYRNSQRIGEFGGRSREVLRPVSASTPGDPGPSAEQLRERVRSRDVEGAERMLAAIAERGASAAFNELLPTVHDQTEVHRVVLPYRAWEILGIVGQEHAHTLLRQSVRYCVRAESWSRPATSEDPRSVLPKLFDEFRLHARVPGDRVVSDEWVAELARTFFQSSPTQAAQAAAAALAEDVAPGSIGEAIALAANELVLRDQGRRLAEETQGKPVGSVHGDSIGVHAADSANAWRNMARVGTPRNCFASLILGAYQVALDRTQRGGSFLEWKPLPLETHLAAVKTTDPASLLREAEEAIRGQLQARASAIIHRYGSLGHDPRPAFDLLLRYAVSEDGALHAEKFYRTVVEEFATARPAFRWRHVVGLARVTASEYGRPAAGISEARSLLGLV